MFQSVWLDPDDGKVKVWYWSALGCTCVAVEGCTAEAPDGSPHQLSPQCNQEHITPTPCHGPLPKKEKGPGARYSSGLLYAESTNGGRDFIKPSLGLVQWQNSTSNNIVWRASEWQYQDGISVTMDLNDVPERKWKMVTSATRGEGYPCRPLSEWCRPNITWDPRIAVSADGLHWSNWQSLSVAGRWDTYPASVYDTASERWAIIHRGCNAVTGRIYNSPGDCGEPVSSGLRVPVVSFSSGKDFLGPWAGRPQVMAGLNGGSVYNVSDRSAFSQQPDQVTPFRYAGMWLAFLNQIEVSPGPDGAGHTVAGAGPDMTLQAELVSSVDLVHWRRLKRGQPFLARGGDGSGAGDACASYGSRTPIVSGNTTRLFFEGADGNCKCSRSLCVSLRSLKEAAAQLILGGTTASLRRRCPRTAGRACARAPLRSCPSPRSRSRSASHRRNGGSLPASATTAGCRSGPWGARCRRRCAAVAHGCRRA